MGVPTALDTYALTDVDDVKEFLGLSDVDDSDHELFRKLINQASAFVEKETDRNLKARDYDPDTDYENARYDGDGTKKLHLRQYPVNSVTTLVCSGTTISAAGDTDYYGSTGYVIYKSRGMLYYSYGFDSGIKNVRVTYNGGYAAGTIELDDLRMLCNSLVAWVWNRRKNLGFKSERIGNYSYTMAELMKENQMSMMNTINRYRRKVVGGV